MAGPLDGIVVVEFTSVILGPLACQTLGDMGANIIKVEPPYGDSNRNIGPYKTHADMSALYLTCNRNKRSIVLDLKTKKGHEAALRLCKKADVIVHNLRPSAMVRLGLDYQQIQVINPKVIYCATYGYSKKGPNGDMGALDDSIQAASGIAHLMSMTEGEPRYIPTVIADKATGGNVVQAILAALFHRERTGQGQEIEVPMFESMVAFTMVEHLWGRTFEPPLDSAGYPRLLAETRKPYPTKDGYLATLPYWDTHWQEFCKLVDRPDLAKNPDFNTMQARTNNMVETCNEIGKIIAKKTTASWLELFAPTHIPHMAMNTLDSVVDDAHLMASGFWQIFDHPSEGKIRMTSPPINFSKTPASIRSLPPRLGEHSQEILEFAGYTPVEITAMQNQGITNSK